jgi:hypothetical protein
MKTLFGLLALAALSLSGFGCAQFKAAESTVSSVFSNKLPSTDTVTSDIKGFVAFGQSAANLVGEQSKFNDYVASASSYLQGLNAALEVAGAVASDVLPSAAVIQSDLAALAKSIGNPSWAVNFNAAVVKEYSNFYTKVSADSVVAESYISAVIAGL